MPLPTTPPVKLGLHNHNAPPMISAAGDVYHVGRFTEGVLDDLAMMKADPDPETDSNWSEQDSGNRPDNGTGVPMLAHWVAQ